jgi:hypothetical protein
MAKKPIACPSCGSGNVRKKRGWSSAIVSGILFVIAFVLTGVRDEGVGAGSTALLILLVIPLIGFTVAAIWGKNRCLACRHGWK